MTRFLLIAVLSLWATTQAAASFKGWTTQQLITELGEPGGVLEFHDATLLMFDRGNATIVNGYVIDDNILSKYAYRKLLETQEEARKRWQEIQIQQARTLHEQAVEMKEDRLRDPQFLSLPLKEQLNFWRNYQLAYPEISIEPHYSELLERYQQELKDQRIHRLEAHYAERIARAEERAARAQQAAARAQRQPIYRSPPAQPVYIYTPEQTLTPGLHIRYQDSHWGVRYHHQALPSYLTPSQQPTVIRFLQ